jgi:hypothetical protein
MVTWEAVTDGVGSLDPHVVHYSVEQCDSVVVVNDANEDVHDRLASNTDDIEIREVVLRNCA